VGKHVNGSQPPAKKPVVRQAYNVANMIAGPAFSLYRAGPVDCIQNAIYVMVNGLTSLKDQEKFPEFVAAARKPGSNVKIIITLAVEEEV